MLNAARAGTPVTWSSVDPDRLADIAALDSTLTTVERVLDVDGLRHSIETLEHEASDPKLWDDQARAQRVTSELSHAQGELRRIQELLYGRNDANLRELLTRAKREQQPVATLPPFSAETWNVTPLEGSFALIGRDGARPTAAQVTAINRILQKQKVTSR